ncbi:U1 small nuclear ribonucleoprotein [Nymphaea thermarum]|nr:U1 small nuclear ribonucleoprotein [Nymphaea thermarum]
MAWLKVLSSSAFLACYKPGLIRAGLPLFGIDRFFGFNLILLIMGDYNDAFMRGKDAGVQARTKAQNRATVLQLKLFVSEFAKPGDPEYSPPVVKGETPSYETTEHRIKREFEAYGPIKRVAAYKQADGRKIDNRRVLVDVERGRTVPNWRPRRLGGGLGSTRIGGEDLNQKHSGSIPVASVFKYLGILEEGETGAMSLSRSQLEVLGGLRNQELEKIGP